MTKYTTEKGTLSVAKVEDLRIVEVMTRGRKWYKLPQDTYYVFIITYNPSVVRRKLYWEDEPTTHLLKSSPFFGQDSKNEFQALMSVRGELKDSVEEGLYPQVMLEILDEAILEGYLRQRMHNHLD
jgi:hypothetical protein